MFIEENNSDQSLATKDGKLFLIYYTLFAVGLSFTSVVLSKFYPWDYFDELFCTLIPPILFATQYYDRKIVLSSSAIAYCCTFIGDFLLLEKSYETLVTITFIFASIIVAQELIYRAVVNQRQLRFKNLILTGELEKTLEKFKHLSELLPICDVCNKLRTDEKIWCDFEEFLQKELDTKTDHGICEDCLQSIINIDEAM